MKSAGDLWVGQRVGEERATAYRRRQRRYGGTDQVAARFQPGEFPRSHFLSTPQRDSDDDPTTNRWARVSLYPSPQRPAFSALYLHF